MTKIQNNNKNKNNKNKKEKKKDRMERNAQKAHVPFAHECSDHGQGGSSLLNHFKTSSPPCEAAASKTLSSHGQFTSLLLSHFKTSTLPPEAACIQILLRSQGHYISIQKE